MINRTALVKRVSSYLTDDEPGYEFTHWTEYDLRTYFDLALKVLTVAIPELARGTCVFMASSGSITPLPPCCENLLNVVSVKVDGKELPYQPRRVTTRANRYAHCATSTPYKMDSWAYDNQEGGSIYFVPPVPDGTEVEVTVQCVKALPIIDDNVNIPSRHEAALFELMLYYAWGVDIESPASRDRSTAHYKVAMDLLGLAANHNFLSAFTRIPEAIVRRSSK